MRPFHSNTVLSCAVIVTATLCGNLSSYGQCELSFDAPRNTGTLAVPFHMAIGDLNNDGWHDVAVAHLNANAVTVLLGGPGFNGIFGPFQNYSINAPSSIAIADVDMDGWPDLVASSFSGNASVFLNDGDGTFAAAVNYGTGPASTFVAIADLNGDTCPDLAVTNQDGQNVSILLGNCDGTFATAVNYFASAPRSVTIGDMNGDSLPDLVVAAGSIVRVLIGNGDGTFAAGVNYLNGNVSGHSVAMGDFDNDGAPDVATTGFSSALVFRNNGDGTLAAAVSYNTGMQPLSIAVDDLTGEGALDLVVANGGSQNVSILAGNGDGTFAAAVNINAPFNGTPRSVVAGDLDQDGGVDIALVSNNGSVISVFLNNGFTFVSQPSSKTIATGATAVLTAEIVGVDTASLQWFHNGAPLMEGPPFSGVETDTLTITDATPDEVGAYELLVSTTSCSAMSDTAFLCVVEQDCGTPGDFDGDDDVDMVDFSMFQVVFTGSM